MPFLIALSLVFQTAMIIHVIKTDRERYWIVIILGFSFLGGIAYFLIEMLPEIRRSRAGRHATKQILTAIDPQRDLKQRAQDLALTDNIENRIELAKECAQFGLLDDAIKLYKESLRGVYEHDPNIMLNLAQALFQKQDFQGCKQILEQLIEKNPDFKSQDGHLLFARTLEALADEEAALHEYSVLSGYYSGYEAKCRYALLLRKLGRSEQADSLFNEIVLHAKNLPKDRRKVQKEWIHIAQQQMA
ncbi:tetratricopeptide repeat protein [Candidatus Albibeggiatoa sp. nov. NOAA]|uniref:tetratricopeptide repeat protein n=1 Tax=Candidatus Albibeggiatoa sp. nov. NOAA TaxID=3162724 RepID=UPI003301C753|nr:tetratricopeptide repeat protein [Thiotrichaceae bacterium]